MVQRNWVITDYCKDNIKQLGFIYNERMDYWSYSFPIRFWKRMPTLLCCVHISRDKDHAWVNVFDNMGCYYSPFYSQEYGQYDDFIKTAEKKILYKLSSLGIIEKKPKNKEKNKHERSRTLRKSNKDKVSRRRT